MNGEGVIMALGFLTVGLLAGLLLVGRALLSGARSYVGAVVRREPAPAVKEAEISDEELEAVMTIWSAE